MFILGVSISITAMPGTVHAEEISSTSTIRMDIAEEETSVNENSPMMKAVTSSANETIIYNFLKKELNLNTAAACGILANIYKESAFNPTAGGDNGTSYGICQWHNTRKTTMQKWCTENGYDYTTVIGQLYYLKHELSANDRDYLYNGKKIYDEISAVANTAEGAYEAARIWCVKYEIPANKEAVAVVRGNLAKDTYWPYYSSNENDDSSLPYTDVKTSDWYYEYVSYVVENGLMNGMSVTFFGAEEPLTRAQFAVILYRLEGEESVNYEDVYRDVKQGEWYTDAIVWANKVGLITGYGNGYFGTNDAINREQMATIMYRYASSKGYNVGTIAEFTGFSDASKVSDWAEEAMRWAVGTGIIKGENGLLNPAGNANRAQCATIIMRFMEEYN